MLINAGHWCDSTCCRPDDACLCFSATLDWAHGSFAIALWLVSLIKWNVSHHRAEEKLWLCVLAHSFVLFFLQSPVVPGRSPCRSSRGLSWWWAMDHMPNWSWSFSLPHWPSWWVQSCTCFINTINMDYLVCHRGSLTSGSPTRYFFGHTVQLILVKCLLLPFASRQVIYCACSVGPRICVL